MNWVFENNFQAGFTPFSSLTSFKDFAFVFTVMFYGTGFTTTICSATTLGTRGCSRVRCGGNFPCRPKADTALEKSETALEKSLAPRVQRNRSLQHCCGIVLNYMCPNLAELKIVVVNPVE